MLRHLSSQSINNLPNQQVMMQSKSEHKKVPSIKNIRGFESSSAFANTVFTNFDPISSSIAHPANMPIPPPRRKKLNEVRNIL